MIIVKDDTNVVNLKGELDPWRLARHARASFLKSPLDTEARTLLAWPGIYGGVAPAP